MSLAILASLSELHDAAVPDALKELLIDKVACEAKIELLRKKRALRPLEAARLRDLERQLHALQLCLERERATFCAAKSDCEAFLAAFDRTPVSIE